MRALLAPTRYVAAVERVDTDALYAQGKRALLLDRDNTLVPDGHPHAPAPVAAWLEHARDLGFKMCIVSNNWHRDDVSRSARELGLEAICRAMKPSPVALDRALARLGVTKRETVMLGDQLYTDVWAGKLARLDTILVRPQVCADLWYTRVLRIFERGVLKDLACEE